MQERTPTLEEQLLEEAFNEPHPRLWIAAAAGATSVLVGETIFVCVQGNLPGTVALAALTAFSAGVGIRWNRRYKRILRYFNGKYPHP